MAQTNGYEDFFLLKFRRKNSCRSEREISEKKVNSKACYNFNFFIFFPTRKISLQFF